MEYNVNGIGNQTVNIQFGRGKLDNRWIAYTVSIDGNNRAQGDGWTLSSDGWITIMAATNNVKITYGLAPPKSFPPGSQFAIPALNGSVSFTDGGIYIFTDFNGSMWQFQELILGSNASSPNEVTWGLGFSAENCAVQVSSWAPNLDSGGWVNYTVQGVGAQTLNANYDRNGGWPINYTVYIDGKIQRQNVSWSVTSDDWLTVTGATANVSITGIENIPEWVKNMPPPGPPALKTSGGYDPWAYAAVFVAITIALGVGMLLFRRNKKSKLSTLGTS